jgi:hypothetical protein
MKAVCSTEKLTPTYQSTPCHQQDSHDKNIVKNLDKNLTWPHSQIWLIITSDFIIVASRPVAK